MSLRELQRRIAKLEAKTVDRTLLFTLADGRKYGFRKSKVLAAFSSAMYGEGDETETFVLMNAIEASDGSQLHLLLQMVLN